MIEITLVNEPEYIWHDGRWCEWVVVYDPNTKGDDPPEGWVELEPVSEGAD